MKIAELIKKRGFTHRVDGIELRVANWLRMENPLAYYSPVVSFPSLSCTDEHYIEVHERVGVAAAVLRRAINRIEPIVVDGIDVNMLSGIAWLDLKEEIRVVPDGQSVEPRRKPQISTCSNCGAKIRNEDPNINVPRFIKCEECRRIEGTIFEVERAILHQKIDDVEDWPRLKALLVKNPLTDSIDDRSVLDRLFLWLYKTRDIDHQAAINRKITDVIQWIEQEKSEPWGARVTFRHSETVAGVTERLGNLARIPAMPSLGITPTQARDLSIKASAQNIIANDPFSAEQSQALRSLIDVPKLTQDIAVDIERMSAELVHHGFRDPRENRENWRIIALHVGCDPDAMMEDIYEAAIAYRLRQNDGATTDPTSIATATTNRREKTVSRKPSPVNAAPSRRGRLSKEESELRKTRMLAQLREHPTLKDNPAFLANMVDVHESTIRRWISEFEEQCLAQSRNKSDLDDD